MNSKQKGISAILVIIFFVILITSSFFMLKKFRLQNITSNIGGNPADILISGEKIFILDEGHKVGHYDYSYTFTKPVLWELDMSKKLASPHIIYDKYKGGKSCNKMVDLKDSIFISCHSPYLFYKNSKTIRKVDQSMPSDYLAANKQKDLMVAIDQKNIFLFDSELNQIAQTQPNGSIISAAIIGDEIYAFGIKAEAYVYDRNLTLKDTITFTHESPKGLLSDENNLYQVYFRKFGVQESQFFSYNLKNKKFQFTAQDSWTTLSFNQSDRNLLTLTALFLVKNGKSDEKNYIYNLGLISKENFHLPKYKKIEFKPGDKLPDLASLINYSAIASNDKQIYLLIKNSNNSKIYIYDTNLNFIEDITLQKLQLK